MKIYLAGPINGCTDSEANDWRSDAKTHFPDTLDPMARDYRGKEAEAVNDIVEGDKADIDNCDAMLVWFEKPSVGTSMEVLYAWERKKQVVTVNMSGKPISPWLAYHSTVVTSMSHAVALLTTPTSHLAFTDDAMPTSHRAFEGCPIGMECAHDDGDRTNNKPANLLWKTCLENQADRKRHGTLATGSRVGTSKLTEPKVIEIVSVIRSGCTGREAAKRFGVNPTQISKIMNGTCWSHATGIVPQPANAK